MPTPRQAQTCLPRARSLTGIHHRSSRGGEHGGLPPDVAKTKVHPSLHRHGHHADCHGRPRQHRYHAHRPRRAHHQQHRCRRQQPVYDEDFDQPSVITRTARRLDDDNGQRAHSTLGNQSPQMYTQAAGMTLEPHSWRDACAAERLSPPSPSSGSRSCAPHSLKKGLALHRAA